MSELVMRVGNGLVNCSKKIDMGYTKEEWEAMSDNEQIEIQNQLLWENLDIYIEGLEE